MTLCIAAHAHEAGDPRVVLCFDSQSGTDEFASETLFKCDYLTDGVVALFAGTIPHVKELFDIYKSHLSTSTLTLANRYEVLWKPMKIFKDRKRKRGSAKVKATLLIAGFIEGKPKIIEVNDSDILELDAYGIIGTATEFVESLLHWRGHSDASSLSQTLYYAYEAKRMGEVSPRVGNLTAMYVLEPMPDGAFRRRVISPDGMQLLDAEFKRYGPQEISPSYTFPADHIL